VIAALLAACVMSGDIRDLPLREFAVEKPAGRFAVILTGDGGWRRIDDKIAERLREANIPVAGFLTPDYYRRERSPEDAACALERVIRHYSAQWKCDRVIVVGYSRGADVLPFMITRLDPEIRRMIDEVALLGLEPAIEFRYHRSWIPFFHPHEAQFPVLPEAEKLRGMRVVCVYGEEERDTICPALVPWATVVREKGGHHFGGDYRGIAEIILRAVPR
jgi:type IV secretory pathway VirJ component